MGNTFRLDFNIDHDAWESSAFYNAAGLAYSWDAASVFDVAADINQLNQVDENGIIYQMEVGATDNGDPIRIKLQSKKFPLERLCLVQQIFIRLQAADDTFTLTVTTGGSEYGTISHDYSFSGSGVDDVEIKIRCHRDLLGRWLQLSIKSSTTNLPAIRELVCWYIDHRNMRVHV